MTHILHILTRPDDSTAREVIQQQRNTGVALTVIDLNGADPDYCALVTAVFASDAVQVW